MIRGPNWLYAIALSAVSAAAVGRDGAAPKVPAGDAEPAAPASSPPMPWAADPFAVRRAWIDRERRALRAQLERERTAARNAMASEREAWAERWRNERAQARKDRLAHEERARRQQAERFPDLGDYRRRNADEFDRRWREIQARRELVIQHIEPHP